MHVTTMEVKSDNAKNDHFESSRAVFVGDNVVVVFFFYGPLRGSGIDSIRSGTNLIGNFLFFWQQVAVSSHRLFKLAPSELVE